MHFNPSPCYMPVTSYVLFLTDHHCSTPLGTSSAREALNRLADTDFIQQTRVINPKFVFDTPLTQCVLPDGSLESFLVADVYRLEVEDGYAAPVLMATRGLVDVETLQREPMRAQLPPKPSTTAPPQLPASRTVVPADIHVRSAAAAASSRSANESRVPPPSSRSTSDSACTIFACGCLIGHAPLTCPQCHCRLPSLHVQVCHCILSLNIRIYNRARCGPEAARRHGSHPVGRHA